jgi:hypothetical protein
MNTQELQLQISREAWERYRKLQGTGASTPAVDRLRATIADIERKHGKAPATAPKPEPMAPGPKTREVAPMVEALRQARRGNVGEASATTGAPHKLPPHVTYG